METLINIIFLVIVAVAAMIFFARARRQNIIGQLDSLRAASAAQAKEIQALKLSVAELRLGAAPRLPDQPQPDPEPQPKPAPSQAPLANPPEPVRAEPVAAPPPIAPKTPPTPPPPRTLQPSFEERLTSRWLVWFGAVTIALGGIFLVKFSIDYGLITPEMRIILGFALGAALTAGGEWLRRGGASMKIEALRGSYVPPALTAAGLFIAYASIYAGFALYAMMTAPVAFVLLALLSFTAFMLAMWHGRGVALLGLSGGFLTPVLVASDEPNWWALFLYLSALVVTIVAVIRFMRWYPLLWAVLTGVAFWLVASIAAIAADSPNADIGPIGIFILVTTAAFCAALWDAPPLRVAKDRDPPPPFDLPPSLLVSLGIVFFGALAVFDLDLYETGTIVLLSGLTALQVAIAVRVDRLASLALTAALLAVAAFYRWPAVTVGVEADTIYLWATGAFAVAFAATGFAKIWASPRTLLWAWLSALTPLVLFAIAYWNLGETGAKTTWTAAAVGIAFAALVAAERTFAFRDRARMIEAVGAYSSAAIGALALGLVFLLEEAWLTVALSLFIPALAWTDRRLDIPAHRNIAFLVLAVVVARLVLNPDILSYEAHGFAGPSWVSYGYGVPALACFAASCLFAARDRGQIVTALEAIAMLFACILVFFEIRALATGSIAAARISLFEGALHTLTWGIGAYALERLDARASNMVVSVTWKVLIFLACLNTLLGPLTFTNPIWTSAPVGALLIVNDLLLAYAAPAAIAFAFALRFRERELWPGSPKASELAGWICLALSFIWISFETRHLFRGSVLSEGEATDAELYAYSVVWLLYAAALLALAIWRSAAELRWASLVILFLTVVKVFVSDMSSLTGLWRVASFIGLGLTLVAIGFFYQRYVFPHREKPETAAPGGS